MNSEELEQSLRSEFESYLKGVFADIREETVEFQKKIEAEFEEQRSHLDIAFEAFSARFDTEHQFDGAFTETVVEHLRLARDEGAQISANAFAEAEDLEKASTPTVSFAEMNEAISDISSKDTQSTILKSLITHAANYTPRGAFFIIKNEHFVGWKVFGKEGEPGETAIREIHFPITSDSILGKAVTSLSTVEGSFGSYPDDSAFLETLDFGRPDRMYAIPLMARGRGVAVLYADYGHEGVTLNTDALETLVRVAGMTVELLASAKAVRSASENVPSSEYSTTDSDSFSLSPTTNYSIDEIASVIPDPDFEFDPAKTTVALTEEVSDTGYSSVESTSNAVKTTEIGYEVEELTPPAAGVAETVETSDFVFSHSAPTPTEFEPETFGTVETAVEEDKYGAFAPRETQNPFASEAAETVNPPLDEVKLADELSSYQPEMVVEEEFTAPVTEPAMAFNPPPFAPPVVEKVNPFEAAPFDTAVSGFEPATMPQSGGFTPDVAVETVTATVPPQRSRLSDRNVDLPIHVAEDERRLHNDARRFARLLVSEIKLYNEKKVQEGRAASDIYDRLREAIDRSREMYDKRVQPPVAAKFDYFHYEIVNALGDGEESKLGNNYPGGTV